MPKCHDKMSKEELRKLVKQNNLQKELPKRLKQVYLSEASCKELKSVLASKGKLPASKMDDKRQKLLKRKAELEKKKEALLKKSDLMRRKAELQKKKAGLVKKKTKAAAAPVKGLMAKYPGFSRSEMERMFSMNSQGLSVDKYSPIKRKYMGSDTSCETMYKLLLDKGKLSGVERKAKGKCPVPAKKLRELIQQHNLKDKLPIIEKTKMINSYKQATDEELLKRLQREGYLPRVGAPKKIESGDKVVPIVEHEGPFKYGGDKWESGYYYEQKGKYQTLWKLIHGFEPYSVSSPITILAVLGKRYWNDGDDIKYTMREFGFDPPSYVSSLIRQYSQFKNFAEWHDYAVSKVVETEVPRFLKWYLVRYAVQKQ